MQKKYLYLAKHEWSLPWRFGGTVPIFPARRYLSTDRHETRTPDEIVRTVRGAKMTDISRVFKFSPEAGVTVKDISIQFNDGRGSLPVFFESAPIEGYILSLSNRPSQTIMKRLGKVCCLEIADVEALCSIIGDGLACEGMHQDVKYVADDNRGVFKKSIQDDWQVEYRLFFSVTSGASKSAQWVVLPRGFASEVRLCGKTVDTRHLAAYEDYLRSA